ncbi:MAG: cobyrinate a,c-diamide synthase [candidate division Zixibacteria bacterium]|nr:cobyrinate a,c-diamide synthase [candidate division Zixibacteria bacterium]
MQNSPRLIIAGLSGDSGKTLVSLGLIAYWRKVGLNVIGFKKGPDYIDSSWLSYASGKPSRNLDAFIMGRDNVYNSFVSNACEADISVIEGNRGLYDGMDYEGKYSTAELAILLDAPVILVVDATKATRTIAAIVKGCMDFDPELNLAGVIINNIAGERHRKVITEAIEEYCGIPVVGSIPKIKNKELIPGRHLGLVTPQEYGKCSDAVNHAGDIVTEYVNVNTCMEIAKNAPLIQFKEISIDVSSGSLGIRICYFNDSAFTFYYPENLELLSKSGAELIPVSSLETKELPECDALYIGGGFPETHAEVLTGNRTLMDSIKLAAESGLPIYAECGGLIYLSKALIKNGEKFPMADVLPVEIEFMSKPQGHGYVELNVDYPNPFFPDGIALRGHEFHYTRIISGMDTLSTAFHLNRGTGCGHERDGLVTNNVLASYTHLHAIGSIQWVDGILKAAKGYRLKKSEKQAVEALI